MALLFMAKVPLKEIYDKKATEAVTLSIHGGGGK